MGNLDEGRGVLRLRGSECEGRRNEDSYAPMAHEVEGIDVIGGLVTMFAVVLHAHPAGDRRSR